MEKNKSLIIKVICTVIGLLLIVGAYYLISTLAGAKYDGEITIELRDLDNKLLEEKEIKFNDGDKLDQLLIDAFGDELEYDTTEMYGMNITKIGDLTGSTFDTYLIYIAIYQNGEYANFGVSFIPFEDGDVITLKLERYDYEW